MKKYFLFFCYFLPILVLAQSSRPDLHFGDRRDEKAVAAIESQEGGIIALAQRETSGDNGTDGLLIKINAKNKEVFRKTVGTIYDDNAQALCQDMMGNILVSGISSSNDSNRIWLQCIGSNGSFVWENNIFSHKKTLSVAGLQVIPGSQDISIIAIADGVVHFIRCDNKGVVQQTNKVSNNILDKNKIKDAKALILDDALYVYGLLSISDNRNCPFIIKLIRGKVVHELTFPDIHAIEIGKMRLFNQEYFAMTGTCKKGKEDQKEEIFYIKADTSLQSKRTTTKVFHYFGEDYGMDVLPLKSDSILILGTSTSFLRGSNTTDYMLMSIDDTGISFKDKPEYFGTQQNEKGLCFVQKSDGSTWIVGTKDIGNAIIANDNINLIELTKPKKIAANIKEILQPLQLTVSNEDIKKAAYGETFSIELSLKNENTYAQFGNYLLLESTNAKKGVRFDERFSIKEVQGKSSVSLNIPVMNISEKEDNITITLSLFDANNKKIVTKDIKVELLPAPKADIILSSHRFEGNKEGKFIKGKKIKLFYTLENKGNKAAEKVSTFFLVPENCRLIKDNKEVITLAEGQKIEGVIELQPLSSIKTEQLIVKVFVKDQNTKVEKVYDLIQKLEDAPIETVQTITQTPQKEVKVETTKKSSPIIPDVATKTETAVENPTPNTNTLLIISWRDDYSKNDMIDWKYQKFEIKININSSQDISNDNIEIYVNDKQYIYSGSKMDEVNLVSNKKKNAFYFNADLLLTPGINRIYAKVKKNGAEDRTDEIKINYNQRDKGILHIVSIGIIDSKNSLKYTRKDAEDFADLFKKQQGKIYSEVRTTVLTNPSETRKDEITNAISELNLMAKQERIAKEDAVILFISTHGFMGDSTQDLRLKMSNYNPANEENTSISYEKDIQNKIADLPCKKYIFLDACQSGGAIKAYRGKKDDDDAFEKIYQNAIDKIKNNNNNLRIVASCAPTQKSYESPIWENGAFTFAIKKMLQNRTICEQYDNTNGKKDGVITLSELYQYLVKEVPDLVKSVYKAEQTPIMPNNQKNEELPLFAY